jgi:putative aldouronate transport system substrate-binding protein
MERVVMKFRSIIAFVILIFCTFFLTGCKGEERNNSLQNLVDQSKVSEDVADKDIDWSGQLTYSDNIIAWGVPSLYHISERALSEFNQKLVAMGYDFNVKFVALDISRYHSSLREYEEQYGSLDIAFTGFNSEEEKEINLEWLLSGYYIPLNEALSSVEGEELWSIYDSKLWDSVKLEETIFIIPNGIAEDKGIVFAFNKDYITEQELRDFKGDLNQLKPFLEKLTLKDDFAPIIIELSDMRITDLIECDYRNGLIFPHKEKTAYNPYEYNPFKELLLLLNQYYKAGYIQEDFNWIGNEQKDPKYAEGIEKYISKGQFFAYICEEIDESDTYEDIIIYEMPSYIRTRLNGTGIVAGSKRQKEAFLLLALSYTDQELANLLVYGLEGFDYMLKDGVAYSLEGDVENPWANQLSLGIYEKTYPTSGEHFKIDRLTDKKDFYKNHVIASPFLGFNFYQEEYIPVMNKVEKIIKESLNLWKSDDPEKEFVRVNTLLEKTGVSDLTKAVNSQLDKSKYKIGSVIWN